jgi:hypothetical protein
MIKASSFWVPKTKVWIEIFALWPQDGFLLVRLKNVHKYQRLALYPVKMCKGKGVIQSWSDRVFDLPLYHLGQG